MLCWSFMSFLLPAVINMSVKVSLRQSQCSRLPHSAGTVNRPEHDQCDDPIVSVRVRLWWEACLAAKHPPNSAHIWWNVYDSAWLLWMWSEDSIAPPNARSCDSMMKRVTSRGSSLPTLTGSLPVPESCSVSILICHTCQVDGSSHWILTKVIILCTYKRKTL